MNKLMSYIGLAKKAGKCVVGTELTRTAARCGRAKLILVASDASPNAIKRAEDLAAYYKLPLLHIPLDTQALGHAAGKPPAAMAAVEEAFVQMIQKAIPDVQPDNGQ